MEALLRQRLLAGQKRDLDENGAFNVRGSNGLLYRLTVDSYNQDHPFLRSSNEQRVLDDRGRVRNFWVYRMPDFSAPGTSSRLIIDPHEHVLAIMLILQTNARDFESLACAENCSNSGFAARVHDYGGRI